MTNVKCVKGDEVKNGATMGDVLSEVVIVANSRNVGEFSGSVTQSKKRENQITDGKPSSSKKQCFSGKEVHKSIEKEKVFFRIQCFRKGNIVWAKCDNRSPAWPAIVIEPKQEAPKSVRKACIPNTICVMFYGYTETKKREYGWIKDGMIYPFLEYLESFLGQTRLYGSKPNDFRMAIHEAYRAGNGYLNSRSEDKYEYATTTRVVKIPVKNVSVQLPESSQRGQKLKQHCGICKRILDYSGGADYIFCDGCNSCVHTQCANVSTNVFKDVHKILYYCPACKG